MDESGYESQSSAGEKRHSHRKKQKSFGLPFEGPRRLRQVSFGLGLSFGDTNGASDGVPQSTANDNTVTADDDNEHSSDNDRWGRGIAKDFRRTVLTHWKSEMTNLNQTVIATTFFLFFACIAPAITFGAIYAKATGNYIGAVEMIAATAWCGIFYALFGGQPMVSILCNTFFAFVCAMKGLMCSTSHVLYSHSLSIIHTTDD